MSATLHTMRPTSPPQGSLSLDALKPSNEMIKSLAKKKNATEEKLKSKLNTLMQHPKLTHVVDAYNNLQKTYIAIKNTADPQTQKEDYLIHWQAYCNAMIEFIAYVDQQTKLFGSKDLHALGQYVLTHLLHFQQNFFSQLAYLPVDLKTNDTIIEELLLAAADNDVSQFRENLNNMKRFYQKNTQLIDSLKATPTTLRQIELHYDSKVSSENNCLNVSTLSRSITEVCQHIETLQTQYQAVQEAYKACRQGWKNFPIIRLFFLNERRKHAMAFKAVRTRILLQTKAYTTQLQTTSLNYLSDKTLASHIHDPLAGMKTKLLTKGINTLHKFSQDLNLPQGFKPAGIDTNLQQAIEIAKEQVDARVNTLCKNEDQLLDTPTQAFKQDLALTLTPESDETLTLKDNLNTHQQDLNTTCDKFLNPPQSQRLQYFANLLPTVGKQEVIAKELNALHHKKTHAIHLKKVTHFESQAYWQFDPNLNFEHDYQKVVELIQTQTQTLPELMKLLDTQIVAYYHFAPASLKTHITSLLNLWVRQLIDKNFQDENYPFEQLRPLSGVLLRIGTPNMQEKFAKHLETQLTFENMVAHCENVENYKSAFKFCALMASDRNELKNYPLFEASVTQATQLLPTLKQAFEAALRQYPKQTITPQKARQLAITLETLEHSESFSTKYNLYTLNNETTSTLTSYWSHNKIWPVLPGLTAFIAALPEDPKLEVAQTLKTEFLEYKQSLKGKIEAAIADGKVEDLYVYDGHLKTLYGLTEALPSNLTDYGHAFVGDVIFSQFKTAFDAYLNTGENLEVVANNLDRLFSKRCDSFNYPQYSLLDTYPPLIDLKDFIANNATGFAEDTLSQALDIKMQRAQALFGFAFQSDKMESIASDALAPITQALEKYRRRLALEALDEQKEQQPIDKTKLNEQPLPPSLSTIPSVQAEANTIQNDRKSSYQLAQTFLNTLGSEIEESEQIELLKQFMTLKNEIFDALDNLAETRKIDDLDLEGKELLTYRLEVFGHLWDALQENDNALEFGLAGVVEDIYNQCTDYTKKTQTYFAIRAVSPTTWKTSWGDENITGMLKGLDTAEEIKAGDSHKIALKKKEVKTLENLPQALAYLQTGKRNRGLKQLVCGKNDDTEKLLNIVSEICEIADFREEYSEALTEKVSLNQHYTRGVCDDLAQYATHNPAQQQSNAVNIQLNQCINDIAASTNKQFLDVLEQKNNANNKIDFTLLLKRLHFMMKTRKDFAIEQQHIRKYSGRWFIAAFNTRAEQDPNFVHEFLTQLNYQEISLFYDCLTQDTLNSDEKSALKNTIGIQDDSQFKTWCSKNITTFTPKKFFTLLASEIARDMANMSANQSTNTKNVVDRIQFALDHKAFIDVNFAKLLACITNPQDSLEKCNLEPFFETPLMQEFSNELRSVLDTNAPVNQTPSPRRKIVKLDSDSTPNSPSRARTSLFGGNANTTQPANISLQQDADLVFGT